MSLSQKCGAIAELWKLFATPSPNLDDAALAEVELGKLLRGASSPEQLKQDPPKSEVQGPEERASAANSVACMSDIKSEEPISLYDAVEVYRWTQERIAGMHLVQITQWFLVLMFLH